MRIISTIEARMTSSRLPGKVLKPILGRPVLDLLVERLKKVELLDEIVIATTLNEADNVIAALSKQLGVKCHRGSEEDVLQRVLDAAKSVKGDLLVEITGDCPLIDPDIVRECITLFLAGGYDYVSNGCKEQTFPDGLGVQVFPVKLLAEVAAITNDPVDREHVTYYIYNHPERYKLKNYKAVGELFWPELQITLDTVGDYELIKTIFEEFYPKNPDFTALDIVRFLRSRPELVALNDDSERRNNYLGNVPRGVNDKK